MFMLCLLLAIAAVVGVMITAQMKVEQPLMLEESQFLTIKPGTSFHGFSKQLVNSAWLDNRFWLRSYVKFNPAQSKIKSGTYQVSAHMRVIDLLNLVVSGKEHQFSITFIEGTSIKQWFELLANTQYIKHELPSIAAKDQLNKYAVSYVDNNEKMQVLSKIAKEFMVDNTNPEGYFYPDTYAFSLGDSDIDILRRAHKKMLYELDIRWQARDKTLPYKTKHEALTMASIIEKESGRYAEHKIIASVFINRIDKKMRLQTDPTVIYGLGEDYYGDITFRHLRGKTPYNTRLIKALPPTPIAMPGKNALDAAFSPAKTDYLYFVSNGHGEHVFSTNLADHNRAVKQYLQRQK
ncbi:MAG: endolytic transglycosylase MltG [Cognaticolwellia sp.]